MGYLKGPEPGETPTILEVEQQQKLESVKMPLGKDIDTDDDDSLDSGDVCCDPCTGGHKGRETVETWYSWWIAFICMLGHVLYYGVSWTVGVYYIIFLEAFQQPAWATSFIGSINTASLYFLAPVGGLLVNRFGCRVLVMIGTTVMAVGLFASFFATNIYVLYVTFGLMAGGGAGIGFIPLITVVSRYFDRRRAFGIGIGTSGVGLGLLVMPALINYVKDVFTWRGSLIILSAIMIQFLVFAAFMKPVHLPEDDEVDSLYDYGEHEKKTIRECMHLDIFKERRYLLLCLNNALLMYGISVVFVHMAAYGMVVGVENSAWLFVALGIATFAGRLFYGFIGQWKRLDFVLVYCVSLIAAGLPIVTLPYATSLWAMMTVASIFGFGTAVLGPYLPQLNIIFLGIKRMPIGYGYLLVFEGIGTLLGAPSAGTLFDKTQLYDYSFYVGGCTIILSGLVLLPAWRWIEPSGPPQELLMEARSQISLSHRSCAELSHRSHRSGGDLSHVQSGQISGEEIERRIHERMYGRSHLTLNQSHEVLAASLSRMVSRQELNRSHSQLGSSVRSLQHSHLSIPRSFSSRLTLHSLTQIHHVTPERAPFMDSGNVV